MRWFLQPFWPIVRVRRWWLENLTTGGNTIVLGLIATANAIWGYPLAPLFSGFIVLLILALMLNRFYRPWLEVTLQAPTEVEQGESLTLLCTLRNERKVAAYDLTVRLRESHHGLDIVDERVVIEAISAGGTAQVAVRVHCRRRGMYDWPTIELTSYFPFGVFRTMQRIRPPGSLAVTPQLIPLRRLRAALPTTTLTGPQLSDHHAGEAYQYLGSREHVTGMPVRRWDFAAWARLGRPIVREFESPRSPQVTIWVDGAGGDLSKRESHHDDREDPTLEAIFSLAASLSRAAISTGSKVRVRLSSEHSIGSLDFGVETIESNSSNEDARVRRGTKPRTVGDNTGERLTGILRRLAAGKANDKEQSHHSLVAAANEPNLCDVFIVVTGCHGDDHGLPEYLEDVALATLNVQVLTIDADNHIFVARHKYRRFRAKRDGTMETMKG